MTNLQFNELVEKAKQYNHFSIPYAESQMYASRNIGTSMSDISLAVLLARKQTKEYTLNELMYKLANTPEFQRLEYELRQKALDIVDLQIAFAKRYNLDIKQNNQVLDALTTFLKENLFTAITMQQKY